jgi:hypothetical protein
MFTRRRNWTKVLLYWTDWRYTKSSRHTAELGGGVRRTFANLAHKSRAPLEQIQIALGHASI